jgi:hypothetical protein
VERGRESLSEHGTDGNNRTETQRMRFLALAAKMSSPRLLVALMKAAFLGDINKGGSASTLLLSALQYLAPHVERACRPRREK